MGLNFRKRVTILPGLSLNFGKRGTSVTVGKRGASMTFGKNGTYANVGIPGTGISYREKLGQPSSTTHSSRRKCKYNYSSNSSYDYPTTTALNDSQSSVASIILLIVLLGGALALFCYCFSSTYSSPGILLFGYTLASLLFAFGSICLGFTINSKMKRESALPVNLLVSAILLSSIAF